MATDPETIGFPRLTKPVRQITAQDMHDRWLSLVIPPGVNLPMRQATELQRVFMAGFYAMMSINIAVGDEPYSEEVGVEIMERLVRECQQFFADVNDGKK